MSRIGKIARLPGPIREQVNRRLENGEKGRTILSWLNANDEVKAVLAKEFDGHEINAVNLCQWRRGGYRDWEMQQSTLDEVRRVMAEGGELAEIGGGALTDKMAIWLVSRYAVATRKLIENENDPAAWKLLRELCHDVVAMRRGDQGAEWLRIEQEKLKLLQAKQQSEREKLKEEILKENPPRQQLSEEEKESIYDEILGPDPRSHPMSRQRNPIAPEHELPGLPTPPLEDANSEGMDTQPLVPSVPSVPSPEENPETRELQQMTELAEGGHAYSAYCLGARYRDGLGVPKDLARARQWLEKAASNGIGGAKIELHALMRRCDPEARLAFDRPN